MSATQPVALEQPLSTAVIQILHVPGCPLVERVATMVEECLEAVGERTGVETVCGEYPSPTLVIDGLDVVTGEPVAGAPRCRLDLPTAEQVADALAQRRMA